MHTLIRALPIISAILSLTNLLCCNSQACIYNETYIEVTITDPTYAHLSGVYNRRVDIGLLVDDVFGGSFCGYMGGTGEYAGTYVYSLHGADPEKFLYQFWRTGAGNRLIIGDAYCAQSGVQTNPVASSAVLDGTDCEWALVDNDNAIQWYTSETHTTPVTGVTLCDITKGCLTGTTTADPTKAPTWDPTKGPTADPSTSPTIKPTINVLPPALTATVPPININVSVTNPALSDAEIIAAVNRSVQHFLDVNFDRDVKYVLVATVVGDATVLRIVVFDLYFLETQELIEQITADLEDDDDTLERQIENDLIDDFGDDSIVVVVKVNPFEIYEHEKRKFHRITWIFGLILCLVILLSFIDAKKCRQNDFHRTAVLCVACAHFLNLWSKAFFAASCTFYPDFALALDSPFFWIFLLVIFFMATPMLISVFQLHREVKAKWTDCDEVKIWMRNNVYSLYFAAVVCGSAFTAVALFTSNAFNLEVFDLPITKREFLYFQTKKIYSSVFLGSIPQFVLHAVFIAVASGEFVDSIVYISLAFSVLTTAITIFSSRVTKAIIDAESFFCVDFEVKAPGSINADNIKYCQRNVTRIQLELALLLGVHQSVIEMVKPQICNQGLRVRCNVYVDARTVTDKSLARCLQNAVESGQLCNVIRDAWILAHIPRIEGLNCGMYQKDGSVLAIEMGGVEASEEVERKAAVNDNIADGDVLAVVNGLTLGYAGGNAAAQENEAQLEGVVMQNDVAFDGAADEDEDIVQSVNELQTGGNLDGNHDHDIVTEINKQTLGGNADGEDVGN